MIKYPEENFYLRPRNGVLWHHGPQPACVDVFPEKDGGRFCRGVLIKCKDRVRLIREGAEYPDDVIIFEDKEACIKAEQEIMNTGEYSD